MKHISIFKKAVKICSVVFLATTVVMATKPVIPFQVSWPLGVAFVCVMTVVILVDDGLY